MKVWLSLLLLTFAHLAHAEPAAFGIRINTTTLDEIKLTHQVKQITSREATFDPASKFCVPVAQGDGITYCDSSPHPSSVSHAYTVNIRDSGVSYFEVRTDNNGVVKFILINFDDPDQSENSRLVEVGRHLTYKYGAPHMFEYPPLQDGYMRYVYPTTNAFVTQWVESERNKETVDSFFVILSDKNYMATTPYDLTPYYHPKGKSAADQL
ncbi:hypothetical protein L1D34_21915 [Vibrio mediterranei]|uniref:hypothetical protein n=1 Tax=Vibrio mediterranei TaxID=689 RepID=UPI001EFE0961|nr:hypothetical protein [Vibrio mediterranei]MCG9627494.1 hypothetical protein [Vibrio mediterranei]